MKRLADKELDTEECSFQPDMPTKSNNNKDDPARTLEEFLQD